MTITKDYFLSRLQNGEDVDTICKDITTIMNDAKKQYDILQAEKQMALQEQEKAKKDLIKEMFEIVEELAILEGVDPEDVKMSDKELEDMYKMFSEVFKLMKSFKKIAAVPSPVAKPDLKKFSDDQIIADFVKLFN